MAEFVYLHSEPSLWTVGYYRPDGKWEPESDHGDPDEAARRVHWLNGGCDTTCADQSATQPVEAQEEVTADA
jgi:hypothetical protein